VYLVEDDDSGGKVDLGALANGGIEQILIGRQHELCLRCQLTRPIERTTAMLIAQRHQVLRGEEVRKTGRGRRWGRTGKERMEGVPQYPTGRAGHRGARAPHH